jgi:hypothetical protein
MEKGASRIEKEWGSRHKKRPPNGWPFSNPNLYPNVSILLVIVYNAILVTGFGIH